MIAGLEAAAALGVTEVLMEQGGGGMARFADRPGYAVQHRL